MGSIRMPSSSDIKKRYEDSVALVPERYKDGVEGTDDFVERARDGQDLYVAKMTDPGVLARREKALGQISDNDWKRPSVEKGAARIGQGMRAGADKQSRNFDPYRSALDGMDLPDKTADPVQNVTNRVIPVVERMVETKRSQLGE